jgi:hypothetical protein
VRVDLGDDAVAQRVHRSLAERLVQESFRLLNGLRGLSGQSVGEADRLDLQCVAGHHEVRESERHRVGRGDAVAGEQVLLGLVQARR